MAVYMVKNAADPNTYTHCRDVNICCICGYCFVSMEVSSLGRKRYVKRNERKLKLTTEKVKLIKSVLPGFEPPLDWSRSNGVCIRCDRLAQKITKRQAEIKEIKQALNESYNRTKTNMLSKSPNIGVGYQYQAIILKENMLVKLKEHKQVVAKISNYEHHRSCERGDIAVPSKDGKLSKSEFQRCEKHDSPHVTTTPSERFVYVPRDLPIEEQCDDISNSTQSQSPSGEDDRKSERIENASNVAEKCCIKQEPPDDYKIEQESKTECCIEDKTPGSCRESMCNDIVDMNVVKQEPQNM